MTDLEQVLSIAEHMGSFKSFLRDHFSIMALTDFSKAEVEHVGAEETVIAHICWNLLFSSNKTFMAVSANRNVSRQWRDKIMNAISLLPDHLKFSFKRSTFQEIQMENGSKVIFRVCDQNAGRGMTVNGLYVIEPSKINDKAYSEFVIGIYPMLAAVKGRQVVEYSRGY